MRVAVDIDRTVSSATTLTVASTVVSISGAAVVVDELPHPVSNIRVIVSRSMDLIFTQPYYYNYLLKASAIN